MFIDEVKVHVKGGRGGNGVTSFARQPYEPKGPPDGGEGGAGGSVILRVDANVATLVDYHHRPHRAAANGRHGEGDLRRGADGDDVVLHVPLGTVVREADGTAIADLVEPGAQFVAARGGRGGRGNAAFKTAQRRAPRFHELGEPPQERWITLELKLVADVALVGFPNAGKSSLISRLSAAKPKIADYPFTTLAPNLGVVKVDDLDFVIADVPGLIPGASEGRGLGHAFLRHVERAGVLVHVLDCASYEQRDPREDLQAVVRELGAYADHLGERGEPGADLLQRPALVFLNKTDADPDTAQIVRPDLEADGWEVLQGSAVTGEGLDVLRHRLADLVRRSRAGRAATPLAAVARPVLRPAARERGFEIARSDEGYRVSGERVQRWVEMTDLSNDEAVRYLQSRLVRAGVEQALVKAGAKAGDAVEIAGRVFDFEPEPGMAPDDAENAESSRHPDAAEEGDG
ncbi:MAG TPA: GTPase ObgE [Egibacteraceae bacterium]|nr:GTPase ObgE [Egibacteraceae bacterium]